MSSSLSYDKSWVSSSLMTQKICHFSELKQCGEWILWCERRPAEGRSLIMGYAYRDISPYFKEFTPQESSVGTDVNEYGGGAWCARLCEENGEETIEIIFQDAKKGGIWRSKMGEDLEILLPSEREGRHYSYADFSLHQEKILCVRECHAPYSSMDVIMIERGKISILAQGDDFYASPRLSEKGDFLAWIAWNHPHMPWTSTKLYLAPLSDPFNKKLCLEGAQEELSVMQPYWCEGKLYALSDGSAAFHASGKEQKRHWNIVSFFEEKNAWKREENTAAPLEIGGPQWVFGNSAYHVLPHGDILASAFKEGKNVLLAYYKKEDHWREIPFAGQSENVPLFLRLGDNFEKSSYCWIDQSETSPPFIAYSSLEGDISHIKDSFSLPKDVRKEDISEAEFISCLSRDGQRIYGLFYPPAQGAYCASYVSKGEKPPLMVLVHGGPTAQAQRSFSFKIHYWTSRGFAVLDVNYRGSTGFGRDYQEALNGQWGILDVQDCCDMVHYVQELGRVDPQKTVIRGSSAGGLTVLSALAHSALFVGGTVLYGVTDLRALMQETHRFEAHYLERLIAPYPEGEEIYKARSPVSWSEKITCPVFFFHGGKDKVVPREHAYALYKKLPQAFFHLYPEEGHGFRRSETLADMFERELAFYLELFEG